MIDVTTILISIAFGIYGILIGLLCYLTYQIFFPQHDPSEPPFLIDTPTPSITNEGDAPQVEVAHQAQSIEDEVLSIFEYVWTNWTSRIISRFVAFVNALDNEENGWEDDDDEIESEEQVGHENSLDGEGDGNNDSIMDLVCRAAASIPPTLRLKKLRMKLTAGFDQPCSFWKKYICADDGQDLEYLDGISTLFKTHDDEDEEEEEDGEQQDDKNSKNQSLTTIMKADQPDNNGNGSDDELTSSFVLLY